MHPVKSETCLTKEGEPRSVFSSEHEAKESAAFIKSQRGVDLTPYLCPKCGCWHLSPQDRQTPSKECIYCNDSEGKLKKLYETKNAALARAEIIKKERGIQLRVYQCPHQEGWHLTKNVPDDSC